MKQRPYWLGLALLGLTSHAFAQSESDALRYSWQQFGGTARNQAIGGASTALGADLGSVATNPAGLGLYQQGEFVISPGIGIGQTQTTGLGNQSNDNRNSLHFGNLGVVFNNRLPDSNTSSDWRSSAFSLNLTRTNDFNRSFRYSGTLDDRSSLFQYLRESPYSYDQILDEYGSNGENITTLDGLGYGAYLTDYANDRNGRDSIYTLRRTGPISVQEAVLTTGSQSQFDISYGANYRDRLYVGGSLGIVSTRYNETRDYTEAEASPSTAFTSLALRDQIQTRGTGLNVRLGVIYRLNDLLRLGASVQTPTFSRMRDTYSTTLNTEFSGLQVQYGNGSTEIINQASVATRPGEANYSLTSPFRATGGAVLMLGKSGFISADAEYVNYGQSRLSYRDENGNNLSYDTENQAIANNYGSAVNLRLGGEFRADIFRLRAGFAHYGDPFQTKSIDRTRTYYTGGVGMRQKNVFLDLTGVYMTGAASYSPYSLNSGQPPRLTITENRLTTTTSLGFLF